MRRILGALVALTLAAGLFTAIAAPAQAATEHCSTHQTKVDELTDSLISGFDGVKPYAIFYYRHCGDGAANEKFYFRLDLVESGATDRGPFYRWTTTHWSVRKITSLYGDVSAPVETGSLKTSSWDMQTADSGAYRNPRWTVWFHSVWAGDQEDTVPDSIDPLYCGCG